MAAGRANFLASSLRRFREAYLFSNEGDEVLRMISTIVNYFSFPTRRRRYGYRLGNLEILSEGFGEIPSDRPSEALRVGSRTLAALSRDKPGALVKVNPAAVAKAFTYFDCTDYVDEPGNKGFLTEAQNRKANNSHGRISYPGHLWLPCRYVFPIGSINVHGGYFDGAATRQLIFRLACLGYDGATDAYQHEQKTIPTICSRHQIRVMLSPWLNYHPSRENMETPAMAASVRRPEPHAA
jgi:hypothetical protein